MAVKPSSDLHRLEDQLTCPVCLDLYTDPKTLACLHSFCQECLERLPQKREAREDTYYLSCPTCRQRTEVPREGVGAFPVAFHINNLKEITQSLKNKVSDPKQGTCNNHFKPLEIYCETCETVICSHCAVRAHKDHEYDLVSDCYSKHYQMLHDSLKLVKGKKEALDKVLFNLAVRKGEIRERGEGVLGEIHEMVEEMMNVLRQSERKLSKEATRVTDAKLEVLSGQIKSTQANLSLLEDVCKCVGQSLKTGTPQQVLRSKKQMMERMSQVTTQINVEELEPIEKDSDLRLIKDCMIVESLHHIGDILTTDEKEEEEQLKNVQQIQGLRLEIEQLQYALKIKTKEHKLEIEMLNDRISSFLAAEQEVNLMEESEAEVKVKDNIPLVAAILKPVEDQWYQLGESLELEESLLNEMEGSNSSKLISLLYTWCEVGDGSLKQIESFLKSIGRCDILPDVRLLAGILNASKSFVAKILEDYCGHAINIKTNGLECSSAQAIAVQAAVEKCPSDIHVAGENTFLIQGDEPQLINWERFGLKIRVSEGSLSSKETADIAAMVTHAGGEFVFPDNTVLVSAVYAISLSRPLFKPLRLEIQHCIDLKSEPTLDKHLKFAVAVTKTSYQFTIFEGGRFPTDSEYGSIDYTEYAESCLVCVVGEEKGKQEVSNIGETVQDQKGKEWKAGKKRNNEQQQLENEQEQPKHAAQLLPCSYTEQCTSADIRLHTKRVGLLYCRDKEKKDLLVFTASKDLNALYRYIEKNYSQFETDEWFHFTLKPSSEYIELKFDTKQESTTGWSVQPHMVPCQIHRDDIDNIYSSYPPERLLSINAIDSQNTVPVLKYAVPVEGIVEPLTFYIVRTLRNAPVGINVRTRSSLSLEPITITGLDSKVAVDAFTENFYNLSTLMNVQANRISFANVLLREKIIPFDCFRNAVESNKTDQEKSITLMIALMDLIKSQPQLILKVINSLYETETLEHIAHSLSKSLNC